MTYSNRKSTKGCAADAQRLRCSAELWSGLIEELQRRTEGHHESGAFLLGERDGAQCRILEIAYYDDLDPHSLDTGIVEFDGAGYGLLWEICRRENLTVVADIHVHPREAIQSPSDRTNPMISQRGHIALIAPDFAEGSCLASDLGVYEYLGGYEWEYRSGKAAAEFFHIGEVIQK